MGRGCVRAALLALLLVTTSFAVDLNNPDAIFTNCGATLRNGPTTANCQSSYTGLSLSWFQTSTNGIQTLRVCFFFFECCELSSLGLCVLCVSECVCVYVCLCVFC